MSEAQFEERADEIAHLLVRVYEIHEIIIAETGGILGLRDAAMLHAAVARPFATFDGQELYPSDLETVWGPVSFPHQEPSVHGRY